MAEQGEPASRGLGINISGLDHVRLARGVVGNATYVVCAAFAAIAAVGWAFSGRPEIALTIICIIAAVAGLYLVGNWLFAHLHPDVALLGGAELLRWRELDMAAKGIKILPDDPNITPPPLIDG